MRIAMLGHKRVPSREGGIEVVVGELSTRLVQCGHEVVCYNRRGRHVSGAGFHVKNVDEFGGVHIKHVPTIDYRGLAAMSASFCAAIACAFGKYDVVHFHAEGPCAMLWIPKLFGKKCIVTVHGLDHMFPKWGKYARRYILFGEWCATKYADEIIVLNSEIQQYFINQYGRKPILIPNGVSVPQITQANEIKVRYGLERGSYILYLGRIVPGKGIEYLINAYRGCQTEKKLVIAGGASDSQAYMKGLQKTVERDENIIFTDFVEGAVLAELYSNAYVYVLPSDGEGMPLTLLEAMSYGNCCLVSDIPGCREILREYGLTFSKGDVEDLRRQLQLLCDNIDLVEKFRKEVARYVLGRFSWESVIHQTLSVYGVNE